ncbi:fumarylacetoacetate hydrolase family protein [Pelagicoccus mobilis]|uniref:Fumarylacetoacetate hydrolase family protein n=1 Tax=Pelagicoccus mobilis TaxID=415221 RepID=A0A934RUC7_9BACT|nr:fumarylacetoacetate hydrolase family protein [Pelagicoccus mobilis]MBK1877022.1 fumarylacetoacetate hydrolase family protein [Pelagicoccus mobilis]
MNGVEFAGEQKRPSKLVCVGRNYVEHIEELGNAVPEQMVLFVKPNSAITSELRAFHGETLHFEAEIAFGILEKEIRFVGFALDLTKRELQGRLKKNGLPWERCKAFDGSAVLSRFVELAGRYDDLEVELLVNGQTRQQGGVDMMIHKPSAVLDEVAEFMELEDYDIILTGTPKGVGAVEKGATYEGIIRDRASGEEILRQRWVAK